jgi:WD40 repeat protein
MNDAHALLERFQPQEPATIINAEAQVCAARYADMPELPPLVGHHGFVEGLAFDPAGTTLFTADSWGELRAWPIEAAEPRWIVPEAHDGWIHAIDASPDGSRIATCGIDCRARVWSAADGARLLEFTAPGEDALTGMTHIDDVQSVAFHPSGTAMVTGGLRGIARHWDMATGSVARQFDAAALFKLDRLQDVGGVRVLRFNADGSQLACGGTKPSVGASVQGVPCVLIFDWASGELRHTLDLGQASDVYVSDLRFHSDGFLMITTCGGPGGGKLIYRRPDDAAALFETSLPNCHSLSLHPTGRRLAIATTNAGSNGNGRTLNDKGEYPDNFSPIHVFDLPAAS